MPSLPLLSFPRAISENCSPLANRVVFAVDCAEKLFDDVPAGSEPPEAHDLRVEAFAKAMARQERHRLHVDVSWQMPPKSVSSFCNSLSMNICLFGLLRCGVDNDEERHRNLAAFLAASALRGYWS